MKQIGILTIFLICIGGQIFSAEKINTKQELIDKFSSGKSIEEVLSYCENAEPPVIFSFRELTRFANLNPPLKLLDCLLRKAVNYSELTGIIKYDGKAFWISERVRCYFKEEDGIIKLLITNLDEKGNRIGGEVKDVERVKVPEDYYSDFYDEGSDFKKESEMKRVQPADVDTNREAPPTEYVVSYPDYVNYPYNPYLINPCLIRYCKGRSSDESGRDTEKGNSNSHVRRRIEPMPRKSNPPSIKNNANSAGLPDKL